MPNRSRICSSNAIMIVAGSIEFIHKADGRKLMLGNLMPHRLSLGLNTIGTAYNNDRAIQIRSRLATPLSQSPHDLACR